MLLTQFHIKVQLQYLRATTTIRIVICTSLFTSKYQVMVALQIAADAANKDKFYTAYFGIYAHNHNYLVLEAVIVRSFELKWVLYINPLYT